MPDFFLTATDPSGWRDTQYVEANSSREAFQRLERLGYREITLHTSDVEAAARPKGIDTAQMKPADAVQVRTLSQFGFFLLVLRMMYRQAWVIVALGLFLLASNLWRYQRIGIWGGIAIALIGMPAFLAYVAAYFGQSVKYKQFLEAASWGRWQEVLDRAPTFRGSAAAFDVAAREASALAALGQLDEGLRRFGAQQTPETARWLYLSRVAEIHSFAKQYDKALGFHRMAYEAAPDDTTMQLGLAMELLRSNTEPQRAKELIEAVKQQPLSDLMMAVLPHVEGLYALQAADFAAAKQFFLTAGQRLQAFASAQPVIGVVIDINRANLAIALAHLGDQAGAQQQFALARPRLVALDSQRVLRSVERALSDQH